MTITCPRQSLLAALKAVTPAVAARTTNPVLACVKLDARDEALTLSATDNEVGITLAVRGVACDRPGATVLSPTRLAAILSETADADVTIKVADDLAVIQTSTGRFELPTHPADAFPDLAPPDASGGYHEVTAGVLRSLVKRTAFAAEKRESTRYAVTGVLWEAADGVLRLVATDTRRLAKNEGPVVVHGEPGKAVLVPRKTIEALDKLLTDDGEVVTVRLTDGGASFTTDRAMLTTKLVEGVFPPWERIIPKSHAVAIELGRDEFLSSVRQAAVATDDEARRVEFAFAAGLLTLTARGATTGTSAVTMPLPTYTGQPITIAFDPVYVTDFLRSTDAPEVTLEMTDGGKAAVFTAGDGGCYLVMPLSN